MTFSMALAITRVAYDLGYQCGRHDAPDSLGSCTEGPARAAYRLGLQQGVRDKIDAQRASAAYWRTVPR